MIVSSLSHLLNAATCGSRFSSFSARAHYCAQVIKLRGWKYVEKVINKMFFWQENHCKNEYEYEKNNRFNPYE
jgi:hypothetical protein